STAEPLRQGPVGAAAGEGKAHHRAGREAIIEPGRAARGARGKVMAADPRQVAGRAVAPPVTRAPYAPRLLEGDRLRRRFQYFGVGESDIVRQFFALRRKADRATAERVAAPVDEGIEHDVEELIGQLERALLSFGGYLAR